MVFQTIIGTLETALPLSVKVPQLPWYGLQLKVVGSFDTGIALDTGVTVVSWGEHAIMPERVTAVASTLAVKRPGLAVIVAPPAIW